MKSIYIIILICIQLNTLRAQEAPKLDDFGRIVLNTLVSDQLKLPKESKDQLENKLKQIAANYGMGGSIVNPRFIITANVSVLTKDLVPGPPQMIAQNIYVTFFIGDAIENKIFSNLVLSIKGVGTNENKAFIDAIKNINTKTEKIEQFISEAKTKIISYYSTQCEITNQKALSLSQNEKFDEAIFHLSTIPEICFDCYLKSLENMKLIYTLKINNEGQQKLETAKLIWSTNPTSDGAILAQDYLSDINSNAKCKLESDKLLNEIYEKLILDKQVREKIEKIEADREFELFKQKSKTEAELEKQRINAYCEVAVEYAKNQPQVVYRNVYWY